MPDISAILKPLRDADWLDREPARVYRLMLALLLTAAWVGWIALSRSGLVPVGSPLGTDFLSFWKIGRASSRERGGQYVWVSVGVVSLKKKKSNVTTNVTNTQ